MTPEDIKKNLNYYSAYFEALFFAEVTSDNDYLKRYDYDFSNINTNDLIKQFKQLDYFFNEADSILENTDYTHEQACHDFYFTRCGHGVGFWENDYCNEDQGKKLTEIAEQYGEIYISDDGKQLFID